MYFVPYYVEQKYFYGTDKFPMFLTKNTLEMENSSSLIYQMNTYILGILIWLFHITILITHDHPFLTNFLLSNIILLGLELSIMTLKEVHLERK